MLLLLCEKPTYAGVRAEKGEAGGDGPGPLPGSLLGGTCDGKEIHHINYLRASSPKTTLHTQLLGRTLSTFCIPSSFGTTRTSTRRGADRSYR